MNTSISKKTERRGFQVPDWLKEGWVWEGLLVVLVTPVVVTSILSIGTGVTV